MRIGNYHINFSQVAMTGPGQVKGTSGVYMNCSLVPFIPCTAAQIKQIDAGVLALSNNTNSAAAPPGKKPVKHRQAKAAPAAAA